MKQSDLEMLQLEAAAGEIDLSIWMNQGFVRGVKPVTLITNFRQQKRLEQTKRRGRRLSIIGLLQQGISFVYGLA
jgi:putative transposase